MPCRDDPQLPLCHHQMRMGSTGAWLLMGSRQGSPIQSSDASRDEATVEFAAGAWKLAGPVG